MRKLLLLFFILITASAQAEIYQWKDSSGRIHFSDTPAYGAQKHVMPKLKNTESSTIKQRRQIPYQNKNGSMIVKAKINHVDMEFIVDTGATLVVIPPEMAKLARIDTKHAHMITANTANGAVQSPMVNIKLLQIEGMQQYNIQAAVQRVSPNAKTGLLGMSFLKAYRVSIDQEKQLITLDPR